MYKSNRVGPHPNRRLGAPARVPKPKAKKAIRLTWRQQLDQYLESASLHGLRYIGNRSLTWFERFETIISPNEFNLLTSSLIFAEASSCVCLCWWWYLLDFIYQAYGVIGQQKPLQFQVQLKLGVSLWLFLVRWADSLSWHFILQFTNNHFQFIS